MSSSTFSVDGMICEHCVRAITGEVRKIDGVAEVNVDLGAKTVTVTGVGFGDDAARAAIDEAGYTVVG